VTVRYRPDALEIDVTDDGDGTGTGGAGTGYGLIGMRERATLFGGAVEARSTERGFLVSAHLLTD
jgi:signal transduction histidine kinase